METKTTSQKLAERLQWEIKFENAVKNFNFKKYMEAVCPHPAKNSLNE